jgi:hypothetical protein
MLQCNRPPDFRAVPDMNANMKGMTYDQGKDGRRKRLRDR